MCHRTRANPPAAAKQAQPSAGFAGPMKVAKPGMVGGVNQQKSAAPKAIWHAVTTAASLGLRTQKHRTPPANAVISVKKHPWWTRVIPGPNINRHHNTRVIVVQSH